MKHSKPHRTTVVDVARAAGVSKSTVSLVLQGSSLVNVETRMRVNALIHKLGYIYNRSAANLRKEKTAIIGIVINDLTNSFFAELAVGMDEAIRSEGYVQFLANTGENVDRQREVIISMLEYGIAGLILSPARKTQASDLQFLTDSNIPTVIIARKLHDVKVSSIFSDNYSGGLLATEHLAHLGHERIAFIGGYSEAIAFKERVQGYHDALLKMGLPFIHDFIFTSEPSRAGGIMAFEKLFSHQHRPTAAICFNDPVAFGVCDGLRNVEMKPGVDFGIVGFDDLIEAKLVVPALTTIAIDPPAMGQHAARFLLKQIHSGKTEPEMQMLPVRLVVRDSCGAKTQSLIRRRDRQEQKGDQTPFVFSTNCTETNSLSDQ